MTSSNTSVLRDFTLPEARPLPVILLLDASGSMAQDGKIESLNGAVADLLGALAREESLRAAVHVGVLAFSNEVLAHLDVMPADQALAAWRPLEAGGRTAMGATFEQCRRLLENRDLITSRSYRPTLVLVSDGIPTDEWETTLQQLLDSPRASKATRLAMGIGPDADLSMLSRFLHNSEIPVFNAAGAREITRFFRWVTMSVVARTRSTTPDQLPPPPPLLDDDDEIRF